MSGQAGAGAEERVAALQAQLAALQEQIASLQAAVAQLEQALANLVRAADSVDGVLKWGEEEVIFPLDPGFNAAVRGRPLDKDRFIVHLGMEYYAEVDSATALKILAARRGRVEESLNQARQRLAALTSLYERYQSMLAEALQAGRAGRQAAPGG